MFKALFLMIVGAFLWLLANPNVGQSEKKVMITYHFTKAEDQKPVFSDEAIKAAFEELRQSCPNLFIYGGDDVAVAGAKLQEAYDYQTQELGWKNTVLVQVKLKDSLKSLSEYTRAAGHTLDFTLGSGTKNGVTVTKSMIFEICGWSKPETGATDFHAIPSLTMLK